MVIKPISLDLRTSALETWIQGYLSIIKDVLFDLFILTPYDELISRTSENLKKVEMVAARLERAKVAVKEKGRTDGWILEKPESSYAPEHVWSNKDLDPVPLHMRTWTKWTIFGYWFSDIISVQSWETGSTILALGLTW